ncbi:MAG: hypothetical protein IAG10_03335 [Planctomycetaceae bacterium]|nr:hypothetical protein [Planctomycetaceae bacterium]
MSVVEAIIEATKEVRGPYFKLPVAGLDDPLLRERVYCYELYHQLRRRDQHPKVVLTAEPDKQGNPSFANGPKPKPDLVFHSPGTHKKNAAVVEVECRPQLRHLRKDMKTLKLMQEKGYTTLVLLLFGVVTVPWKRIRRAATEAGLDVAECVVLLHSHNGKPASIEKDSSA